MSLPINMDDVLHGRSVEWGRLVARRYRNRRIGEFLKELRLTEGRGTGIPTIVHAMLRNGSPAPRFDTDEDRTYFTATLPIHPGTSLTVTPHVTPHVTPYAGRQSESGKMRILLQYCVSPRDRPSIQARLVLKDRKDLRERYIAPALAAGWLAMTDADHPSSRAQQYRTTPSGLARIAHAEEQETPE